MVNDCIFTIGHSNHSIEHFLELLRHHEITAVADVRSQPYSRYCPQFNREILSRSLKSNQVQYVFLGKELGARSKDRTCYVSNKVQYDRLACTDLFQEGLQRLIKGMRTHKIALLCSEKDPLACHRTILVGRHLVDHSVELRHILASGAIESHDEAMTRLLGQLKISEDTLFKARTDILTEAYTLQAEVIAYVDETKSRKDIHQATGTQ